MPHFVTLQASGKRFRVDAGETVLEAAQRAGLALPYSCLAGVCGSCKATLVEGECVYPRNPPIALNAAEQRRLAPEPASFLADGRPTKRDRRDIDRAHGLGDRWSATAED